MTGPTEDTLALSSRWGCSVFTEEPKPFYGKRAPPREPRALDDYSIRREVWAMMDTEEAKLDRPHGWLCQNDIDLLQHRIHQLRVMKFTRPRHWGDLPPNLLIDRSRRFIIKLSLRTGLLPWGFLLEDGVEVTDKHPFAGGGFSDIFRGKYKGEKAAIKRLRIFSRTETDRKRERRMICAESLFWKNLFHPNILPLYGMSETVFAPFISLVMPWRENGNILEFLGRYREERGLEQSLHAVHQWIEEIACAMTYIHEDGIIHGDLRAANILVSDTGSAQVTDFGMAVLWDQGHPQGSYSSLRGGAFHWIAPELLRAEAEAGEIVLPDQEGGEGFGANPPTESRDSEIRRPTIKAELYSFACVCVELYTGRPPFGAFPGLAAVYRVSEGERAPRPRFWGGDLMEDFYWELIQKCWGQEPKGRGLSEDTSNAVIAHRKAEGCPGVIWPAPPSVNAETSHGTTGACGSHHAAHADGCTTSEGATET